MMNLIRKVHGLVERPDLTKHRQSQDRIGAILGTEKGIAYEETEVDGMSCEWVKVERAHLKRYVILYCHGGGYSTGSTVYARTLTTKLAESTGMDVFCFNYRLAPECKFPAAAEDAMKAWNYLMYLGYGAPGRDCGGRFRRRKSCVVADAEIKRRRKNAAKRTCTDVSVDRPDQIREKLSDKKQRRSGAGSRIPGSDDRKLCGRDGADESVYFPAVWKAGRAAACIHSGRGQRAFTFGFDAAAQKSRQGRRFCPNRHL